MSSRRSKGAWDTDAHPHYFGGREAYYEIKLEEADAALQERQLAFAMLTHPRLGPPELRSTPNELVQTIAKAVPRPRPKGWYPYFMHERNQDAFVELYKNNFPPYSDEFLRTLKPPSESFFPCEGKHWRVYLYHPKLNIVLYDGQLNRGVQYGSPDGSARLFLEITCDDQRVLTVKQTRVVRGARRSEEQSTYQLNPNDPLEISLGELKLRVSRSRR
jgi:hypothetical protein